MQTLKEKIYDPRQLYIPNARDEALVERQIAIELYKLRIISVCDPDDMAVMPDVSRPHVTDQLNLFKEYGLPAILPGRIIYIDSGIHPISKAILQDIDNVRRCLRTSNAPEGLMPYISSSRADEISKKLGLPVKQTGAAAEIINNKAITKCELEKLGVRTPRGKVIYSNKQAAEFVEQLQALNHKEVGFKIPRSASGTGVFRIGIDEVSQYLEKYHAELNSDGILLDAWISGKITASPNIQYCIGLTPDQDQFVSCSNQILVGTTHQGNINEPEILERVSGLRDDLFIIRNWIRSMGGYGINGLDYIIREETEGEKAYFLENNGRTNGCTHGVVLTDKIQRKYGSNDQPLEWGVNNNVAVPVGTTTHEFQTWLETSGIAFRPDWRSPAGSAIPSGSRGVLICNTAAIESHGKPMVLIVSTSREDVREMMDMLPGSGKITS